MTFVAPSAGTMFAHAIPAAPAPVMTIRTSSTRLPTTSEATARRPVSGDYGPKDSAFTGKVRWVQIEPMLDAIRRELDAIGVDEVPNVVVADAGYWHQDQMERAIASGSQVLIPPDTSKRKGPRPGWTGGYYDFMRRVLAGELYRQRQPMTEPVFGHTKHNRGMARFHRRGTGAVRAEWRLITATHNLLKLFRLQAAPAPA